MLPTDMKMAQAVMRCLLDYMQTKISTEANRNNRAATEYLPLPCAIPALRTLLGAGTCKQVALSYANKSLYGNYQHIRQIRLNE